jgi:hypothetical protein
MVVRGPIDRTVPVICNRPDAMVTTTATRSAMDQTAPLRRRRRLEPTIGDFQGTNSRKDRPTSP